MDPSAQEIAHARLSDAENLAAFACVYRRVASAFWSCIKIDNPAPLACFAGSSGSVWTTRFGRRRPCSKNRDRLLQGDIAAAFFDAVVDQARQAGLLSDEHFTVDGTLLEAWASLKSFRRKDDGATESPDDPGNPTVNFHGEARRNDTH